MTTCLVSSAVVISATAPIVARSPAGCKFRLLHTEWVVVFIGLFMGPTAGIEPHCFLLEAQCTDHLADTQSI